MFLSVITDPVAKATLTDTQEIANFSFEPDIAECDCTSHTCTDCKYPTCILK